MSCPHLKYSIINKSNGGSVIASSAYNRREKMFDEAENKMKYSHTRADDHVLTKMLLPKNSPASYTNPYRAWTDLNKILIIPFQRELSFNQNLELAIELLNEEYVSKGHVVQIDVHRGKNGNDHLHAIASDRRLVNGAWEKQKSDTVYYKRGTVKELDKHGKVINPDAVILTSADKVDTPKLKRKKLQYDRTGNIIMEKGWQVLQYDANGKPQLDKDGYPILVDIREPDYIPGTSEQKYSKNGKYLKPQWKKDTIKRSTISNIGNVEHIRRTWERLQNEYYKKYNVRDENGKIFTVDLRSYKEQNKVRPADQQMIPTKHIGYGMKSESMLIHNEEAKAHGHHDVKERNGSRLGPRHIGRPVLQSPCESPCQNICKSCQHQEGEQPAEQQEQPSPRTSHIRFNHHPQRLSLVLHRGIQGSKILHRPKEHATHQQPDKGRSPPEHGCDNRARHRPCPRDGRKLMGKHRKPRSRSKIPSILQLHRRRLRLRVNAPGAHQPSPIEQIGRHKDHQGKTY